MNSSFQVGNNKLTDPVLVLGGMGIGVGNWSLARKVAMNPRVRGTISCTAADIVVAHTLQLGDPGGHIRRAFKNFFCQETAEAVLKDYFIEGGKPPDKNFKRVPALSLSPPEDRQRLIVIASFALIWLAKEGHNNPISVNFLEKLQIAHIWQIAGAMLADVDCVTIGAGITLQIPAILDALSSGGIPSYRVTIEGFTAADPRGVEIISYDPRKLFGDKFPSNLKRPDFWPIVSTNELAALMCFKLPPGSIQGFIVELPTAGGHNAPPRVKGKFDLKGQPVYGPKDIVNFKKLLELGIPFWIGGSMASPEMLAYALSLGAKGTQDGTIFALSDDSGLNPIIRNELRRKGYLGELTIFTDPQASPTGFPFKVAELDGTMSDLSLYEERIRICDRSALLSPYYLPDSKKVGLRCSSEPKKDYLRKGGKPEDMVCSRCLCNGLFSAAVTAGAIRLSLGNPKELPIVTLGDDVSFLRKLMKHEDDSYTAADAVKYLLSEI